MPTTKTTKVEASISTEGRFRNGDGKYVFRIYDAKRTQQSRRMSSSILAGATLREGRKGS